MALHRQTTGVAVITAGSRADLNAALCAGWSTARRHIPRGAPPARLASAGSGENAAETATTRNATLMARLFDRVIISRRKPTQRQPARMRGGPGGDHVT